MEKKSNPYSAISFRRDRIAWSITLALLFVFGVSYFWFYQDTRERVTLPQATVVSNNPRIAIIAYNRIAQKEEGNGDISIKRFQSHLMALREKGFTPITLAALQNFYDHGQALPPRSLLLTFDYGERDTYEAVDPILRQMQWPAVMFVLSSRERDQNSPFFRFSLLQNMVESGLWEIGSNGYTWDDLTPINDQGEQMSYAMRVEWLEKKVQEEGFLKFERRIIGKYRQSKEAITSHLQGTPQISFAYPFTKPQRIFGWKVARVHREGLMSSYALGIIDDRFGINDSLSDPYHLKRLRVNSTWSAQELVHRLSSAMSPSQEKNKRKGERIQSHQWVAGKGQITLKKSAVHLAGNPEASLWFPGSQWADAWELETDLWFEGGTFWIVQEYACTESESWRFGGGQETLILQQRSWIDPSGTAVRLTVEPMEGKWHHLKLIRRGQGVWVEWDGKPLADRPFYLSAPRRGDVGLSIVQNGGPTDGMARLRLANLTLQNRAYDIRQVSGDPSSEKIQSLIQESPRIVALSTPWMEIHEEHSTERFIEKKLLSILAHRYGWDIFPIVQIAGTAGHAFDRPEQWFMLTEQIESEGWDGMVIDLTLLTPEIRQRWLSLFNDWNHKFVQKGYQPMRLGKSHVIFQGRSC